MYLNAYGCDRWFNQAGEPYCVLELPAVNWTAVELGQRPYPTQHEAFRVTDAKNLVSPRDPTTFVVALAFFFSYSVISSLVLLSAFLGIVQTAMDAASELEEEQNQEQQAVAEFKLFKSNSSLDSTQLLLLEQAFHCMDLDGSGVLEPAELKICKDFAQHHGTRNQGAETQTDYEVKTLWAGGIETMFDDVTKQKQGLLTGSIFLKAHFKRNGMQDSRKSVRSPRARKHEDKLVRQRVIDDLTGMMHVPKGPAKVAPVIAKGSVLEDVLADVERGQEKAQDVETMLDFGLDDTDEAGHDV
jgi:hypothetical protein